MILPIYAYGQAVLKQQAPNVDLNDKEGILAFIADLEETMYAASGVGLAAPQVGRSERIFIIDAGAYDPENYPDFKRIFINPIITEFAGPKTMFNEGCLSIPDVREEVQRPSEIIVEYVNEKFEKVSEHFEGVPARIIQHEYDHIEGVLFVDRLSPLKKRLLKKRLDQISLGAAHPGYKMKFPPVLKKR